jgi:hypothetical protein
MLLKKIGGHWFLMLLSPYVSSLQAVAGGIWESFRTTEDKLGLIWSKQLTYALRETKLEHGDATMTLLCQHVVLYDSQTLEPLCDVFSVP